MLQKFRIIFTNFLEKEKIDFFWWKYLVRLLVRVARYPVHPPGAAPTSTAKSSVLVLDWERQYLKVLLITEISCQVLRMTSIAHGNTVALGSFVL